MPEFSFLYNYITINETYIFISWSPTNNCSEVKSYHVVIGRFNEPNVRNITWQSSYSIYRPWLLAMREGYIIYVEAYCGNQIYMRSDVSLNFLSEGILKKISIVMEFVFVKVSICEKTLRAYYSKMHSINNSFL